MSSKRDATGVPETAESVACSPSKKQRVEGNQQANGGEEAGPATAADESSSIPDIEKDSDGKQAKETTNDEKASIAKPEPLDDDQELELDPLPESQDGDGQSSAVETLSTPSIVLFGLHPRITTPKLKKFLERYGQVDEVDVKMAFASRYGVCTFTQLEKAQEAMMRLNGRSIKGVKIMVRPGQSSKPSQPRQSHQVK